MYREFSDLYDENLALEIGLKHAEFAKKSNWKTAVNSHIETIE